MTLQPIKAHVKWAVSDAGTAAVEPLQITLNTQLKSTQAVSYKTRFSSDGKLFVLQVLAPSYDAFQQAIVQLGSTFAQIDASAPLDKIRIFGPVEDALKQSMAPLSAEFLPFDEAPF